MKFSELNGWIKSDIERFFKNEDESWEIFDWHKTGNSQAASEMREWESLYKDFKLNVMRGANIKECFYSWVINSKVVNVRAKQDIPKDINLVSSFCNVPQTRFLQILRKAEREIRLEEIIA